MIISSFGFEEKMSLYRMFAMRVTLFEETHFSILSRLVLIFNSFCSPMRLGILHYFFLLVWETQKV